jgi:hypothetical protein
MILNDFTKLIVDNDELRVFLDNPKPLCDDIIKIFKDNGFGCSVVSSNDVVRNSAYWMDNKKRVTLSIGFPITWSDECQEEDLISPIVDKYIKPEMDKLGKNWTHYFYDQYDVPNKFTDYMNDLQG